MGSDIEVLLPVGFRHHAMAVDDLFSEWDARFSRFVWDSELMRLNRSAGTAGHVSPPMLDAVRVALAAASATDGLYDPLLGRRMVALGYDVTFARLPEQRDADPLPPWRQGQWREVALDAEAMTVRLPAGTGLDLGGLAKGMAVDAALDLLVTEGLPYAAVNAGGDLAVHGLPPETNSWSVEIDGRAGRPVSVDSGALATSSIMRRRWRVDDLELHHLIDPRTGFPANTGLRQVSVAAATCREAEVAAKAVLLLGATAGADFVDCHNLAGLAVTDEGEELRLGRWRA